MRGLERPPRWGVVAIVVLLIGNVVLLGYLFLFRSPPKDARAGSPAPAASAAAQTAASSASPAAQQPEKTPVLAVYGDGYSLGSSLGGQGAHGWPALVAQSLGLELHLTAVSRSGYVATGVTGQTFSQLVSAAPAPDADVVIVFGSRNDAGSDPAAVQQAAAQTLTSARGASPRAGLLIIGPAWSNASPPAGLAEISAAVQRAATAAGATYVNPLDEGWFAEPADLIASDGVSPTDAGHAYLADRIKPLVESAMAATQPPR